ncbi:MAG: thioredoxin family protein [Chloroflexota bacterium]
MTMNQVVSQTEWLEARKALLAKEKEFTRLRDQLSQEQRSLPWVKVDKAYVFDSPDGQETLGDLFAGCSQLLVYHFMFHPEWEQGCKSCSFWADNYNGVTLHWNQRDVTHVTISRAPLAKLQAFRQRMGWQFKWVSSYGSDFNYDFHVSFKPADLANGERNYNYDTIQFPVEEAPGVSIFYKDEQGDVFHTYSTYARGLDVLNGAYHHLDLIPKGRDEGGQNMAWLRLRDEYAQG